LATLVQQAHKEILEPLDHKEPLALQAILDQLVLLVLWAILGLLEPQDLRVPLA
jgi:hypothetical protein